MNNYQEKEPIYKEISREVARRNDIDRDIQHLYNSISDIVFKIEGLKQVQVVIDETVARLRALIQEPFNGAAQMQADINKYDGVKDSQQLRKKEHY
jgi:hypothetical protein